ncbi:MULTISPECIES: hypothetical protein [unclassified Streptomyces]|uniref:hypothetical protein n=1 Tax=unclassified Streptomyces TaxID=2593676 RepID=UPI001151D890|nr:hypothetical protein [Streptomyces sp. SLBN-31]TQJ87820.1 hypothetical protein FBY22_6667 [Streptomyces sp. SLBN-31]
MTDAVTGPGAGARGSEGDDGTHRRTVTPTPGETEREGGRTTPAPEETGRGGGVGTERRVVAPTPHEATDAEAGSAYDDTGAGAHTGTPTSGTGRSTAGTTPGTDTGGTDTRIGGSGTHTGGTDTGIGGSGSHTGGTDTGIGGHGSRAGATDAGGAATGTRLLPHDECDKLEARLRHAVAGFVDGPRDAVQEADQVLEEIAGRFAEAVTRRRRTLRMSWQDGKSGGADEAARTDTEQLRLALRDYRELAERLLHG